MPRQVIRTIKCLSPDRPRVLGGVRSSTGGDGAWGPAYGPARQRVFRFLGPLGDRMVDGGKGVGVTFREDVEAGGETNFI